MRSRYSRPTVYVHRSIGDRVSDRITPGSITNVRSCHHVRPGGALSLRALTSITLVSIYGIAMCSCVHKPSIFSSDSESSLRPPQATEGLQTGTKKGFWLRNLLHSLHVWPFFPGAHSSCMRALVSTRLSCSALLTFTQLRTRSSFNSATMSFEVDPVYPGTAVQRMKTCRDRARSLTTQELSDEWESTRKRLLWAAGLKDLTNVPPGQGYTGHAFNDYNHCDATTMLGDVAHNLNDGPNRVAGIAVGNRLGPGIERASDPDCGPGGSWSTCTNGCEPRRRLRTRVGGPGRSRCEGQGDRRAVHHE